MPEKTYLKYNLFLTGNIDKTQKMYKIKVKRLLRY